MDGFHVGDKFYCRELGFSSMTSIVHEGWQGSYRFNLSPIAPRMIKKDTRTSSWLFSNLHGLSVKPLPNEQVRDLNDLEGIVQYLHLNCETASKKLVAFKGGDMERNLLNKLKLGFFNLETIGCPRYRDLPKVNLRNCGYHDLHSKQHCSYLKSITFAKWLQEYLQEQDSCISRPMGRSPQVP